MRIRPAGRVTPIRPIVIANRGEVAVRVIRTARALGIEIVPGASEAARLPLVPGSSVEIAKEALSCPASIPRSY